ncbi:MAG: META domain-containing protein [Gammaproteobacteria bacterium]
MSAGSITRHLILLLTALWNFEAAATELTGTVWRVVKIMSMDDRVYAPDDRSKYTLELLSKGRAAIEADCNRGTGTWTSEGPGQLQFGPIATTRALCPPESLSERYLAQFEWVRSYVLEDGRLFLATMADGSIIEFESINVPPTATLLGEEIHTTDASELQKIVLTRLLDRYAEQQRIEVTGEEIDAFVESQQLGMAEHGLTEEKSLSSEEIAQLSQMRRDWGRAMIRQWKIHRALYQRYGGRIIFQQLGPEPLDAYRKYLEERRSAGDFTIHDKAFEDTFWRYFTDDTMHSFYQPGSEEEAQALTTPWWTRAAGNE